MLKQSIPFAVGLALFGANAAYAFNPTTIASQISSGNVTIVYEAGSSAMRDEFQLALSELCQTGTGDEYGGDVGAGVSGVTDNAWDNFQNGSINVPYNGPDMRVYSCQLKASAPATAPALATVANNN